MDAEESRTTDEGHGRALFPGAALLAVMGVLGAVGLTLWKCYADPSIPFLWNTSPAEWIVDPNTLRISGEIRAERKVRFRTEFDLPGVPATGRLEHRAFGQCILWINGRPLAGGGGAGRDWKKSHTQDVAALLRSGRNTLEADCRNLDGLPALWLVLKAGALTIQTDRQWKAIYPDGRSNAVRLATDLQGFGTEATFPTVWQGWRTAWPVVVVWGLIACVVAWVGRRLIRGKGMTVAGQDGATAGLSRRLTVGLGVGVGILWIGLCVNNTYWFPLPIGFDAEAHLKYVDVLRTTHRLPLANEGWEAYQPPLYYVISALLVGLGHLVHLSRADVVVPRLVNMACGIANVLLVWSVVRLLFPENRRGQIAGLILAAGMPMNLYMSHYPSNEIMCATFVNGAVLLALRNLRDRTVSVGRYAGLGVVLGLAMLSKYTAFLAVVAVGVVVGVVLIRRHGVRVRLLASTLGVCLASLLIVSGWFYLRNIVHFRNPFVGNWDAVTRNSWWAAPGYGTSVYYLRVGRSLTHPFEGWTHSYADSIYSTVWGDGMCGGDPTPNRRPPWCFNLMSVGYTLALVPVGLMVLGFLSVVRRWVVRADASWTLLVFLGLLIAFSVFYMTLKLPYYSQAKGFYGLSCMACLCALGALGFDRLCSMWGRLGGCAGVLLAVWGMNAFASYLVLPTDAETNRLLAAHYAEKDKTRMGAGNQFLLRSLELDGSQPAVLVHYIDALYKEKRYQEVRDFLEEASARSPDDHWRLRYLIIILSGCPDDRIRDGRRAMELVGRLRGLLRSDDPTGVHILSLAQAELGLFPQAIESISRAMALSEAQGKTDCLEDMRKQLDLYKAGRPFRLED